MPQLVDPNFSRTVILLCEHAAEGAFGLIVMRRVDHEDGPGTLMCADCRDYGLESGRYDAGRLGARSTLGSW